MFFSNDAVTMNPNAPLLLLDNGYVSIYRFHAVQKFYRLTHPRDKEILKDDYDWSANPLFVTKYKDLFFRGLSKTFKKYQVPLSNVVFALDDHRTNLWRNKIIDTYKQVRHAKKQNGLTKILEMMRTVLLPDVVKNFNVNIIGVKSLEADDIIAVITKFVLKKKLFPRVIIVTNDKDFLQLHDPNVIIVNLQGQILRPINYLDAQRELMMHVLCGDRSDNIKPCFPKLDRATAAKYVEDPLAFADLLKDPRIRETYIINRSLIDFNYIPVKFQRKIITLFMRAFMAF